MLLDIGETVFRICDELEFSDTIRNKIKLARAGGGDPAKDWLKNLQQNNGDITSEEFNTALINCNLRLPKSMRKQDESPNFHFVSDLTRQKVAKLFIGTEFLNVLITCVSTTSFYYRGCHKFEINVLAVIAFREVGKGHESMTNVSRCLNMFSITETTYHALNNSLCKAYYEAGSTSMQEAVSDIKATSNDKTKPTNCRVSVDGTWQKRGFSSLSGVVTAINRGRCIDVHVMSKSCKKCSVWEKRKNNPDYDYDQWKAEHFKSDQCEINHLKSSSAMDAAGAVDIFSRSIKKNGPIYNEYLEDGDSSSYSEVVSSEPYKEHGNIAPRKLECIGHVQKRLGTRLRNMVKKYKGTSTPFSGKGKLTEKTINSMQNYFGRAIRENKNNLYAMKKATGAILWHCTNFENSK